MRLLGGDTFDAELVAYIVYDRRRSFRMPVMWPMIHYESPKSGKRLNDQCLEILRTLREQRCLH
jgi:hypothetical protein